MCAGRGPIAWVLREYPFGYPGGAARWLESLIASTAEAGFSSEVLLPSPAGIPARARQVGARAGVRSPHISRRSGLAKPPVALRHAGWTAYSRSPAPVQRAVAGVRRRRRDSRGVDHVLGRDWTSREREWLEAELEAIRPSAVLFDSGFAIARTPEGIRRILLLPDLVHERAEAFSAAGLRTYPPGIDRSWEAGRMASVDAVAAIQWDDAATARTLAPGRTVVVAPPAFPLLAEPSEPDSATCLFVGNGTVHNVHGLRWLLDSVWPAVARADRRARLQVAGSVCGQTAVSGPGVESLGVVAALDVLYRRAAVALVPVLAGSGLKVKLAEALCHGRAVITTSVGAQGMRAVEPRPFVVADDPNAFAAEVARAIADRDHRARLERLAAGAASMFSAPAAHADLIDLLR